MMDEYEKIVGHNAPGVITGKPIVLGGSQGRGTATAQGGVYVLHELVSKLRKNPHDMKVIVQGFGNAGSDDTIRTGRRQFRFIPTREKTVRRYWVFEK